MCVFYVFGGPQAPETIIIIGVLETRCVFYVFGDPQVPETTVIIGVLEARCAYFSSLEAREHSQLLLGRESCRRPRSPGIVFFQTVVLLPENTIKLVFWCSVPAAGLHFHRKCSRPDRRGSGPS